jgi:hypothetical protein
MGLISRLTGPKTPVKMLVSVAGDAGEFIAGKQYKVDPDLADQLIARGYAAGGMSRVFSDDEMLALRGNGQTVELS